MDLGTQPRTTAALLSRVGDRIRSRNTLIIEEWEDITAWARDHVVTSPEGAATITEGYLDTGVPIAGPGAPLVSEFALMELVAVLGRSPDGRKTNVGRRAASRCDLDHAKPHADGGPTCPCNQASWKYTLLRSRRAPKHSQS